ncbi:MAG: dephospho-CoA kinase [Bacteroidota bacterium]
MIAIGLTGGVATGKSTVAKLLHEKGIAIVSSDELAHQAMAPGGPAYDRIITEFGSKVVLPDGKINRRLLGEIVFKDQAARKSLEGIVHPIVIRGIREELESHSRSGAQIVVVEVPLLFEAGLMDLFDYVWVVSSSYKRQLQRLQERDRLTKDEAEERIAAQMSLSEKEKRADAVIKNDDGLDSLEEQLSTLLRTLE